LQVIKHLLTQRPVPQSKDGQGHAHGGSYDGGHDGGHDNGHNDNKGAAAG